MFYKKSIVIIIIYKEVVLKNVLINCTLFICCTLYGKIENPILKCQYLLFYFFFSFFKVY